MPNQDGLFRSLVAEIPRYFSRHRLKTVLVDDLAHDLRVHPSNRARFDREVEDIMLALGWEKRIVVPPRGVMTPPATAWVAPKVDASAAERIVAYVEGRDKVQSREVASATGADFSTVSTTLRSLGYYESRAATLSDGKSRPRYWVLPDALKQVDGTETVAAHVKGRDKVQVDETRRATGLTRKAVTTALRKLGYRESRSWSLGDGESRRRYWIKG